MKKILHTGFATLLASGIGLAAGSVSALDMACTAEYNPVCGQTEGKQMQTYGNMCMMGLDNAVKLHAGECKTDSDSDKQALVDFAYKNHLSQYADLDAFGFDRTLSRQEAAAIAVRFANLTKTTDGISCHIDFEDKDEIDKTLLADIEKACGLGIMQGQDGKFSPNRTLSEAEGIAIIMRTISGGKLDETVSPWYREYLSVAESLGMNIDISENNVVTRGKFISWIQEAVSALETNKTVLEGDWNLQFVELENKAILEAKDKNITLKVRGSQMDTKICNGLMGQFSLSGNTINTTGFVSTMMYCEWLMDIEGAVSSLDGATFEQKNENLTIVTAEGAKLFFAKSTADRIRGKWNLVSFDGKAETKDSVLEITNEKLSVKFCNGMSGAYTLDGNTIATTGLVSTKMLCNDEALMNMEYAFSNINAATISFESNDALTITTKENHVFVFEAAK